MREVPDYNSTTGGRCLGKTNFPQRGGPFIYDRVAEILRRKQKTHQNLAEQNPSTQNARSLAAKNYDPNSQSFARSNLLEDLMGLKFTYDKSTGSILSLGKRESSQDEDFIFPGLEQGPESDFVCSSSDFSSNLISFCGYPGFASFDRTADKAAIANIDPTKISKSLLGEVLKPLIQDAVFIDLGCGEPDQQFSIRGLAEILEAKQYVGIDLHNTQNLFKYNEFKNNGFSSILLRADILSFLKKLKETESPKVFLISGIENRTDNDNYAKSCYQEIQKSTKSGDIVIINGAAGSKTSSAIAFDNPSVNPIQYGFRELESPVNWSVKIYQKI